MSWSFSQSIREAPAVTALPSSPEDGDEVIYTDSLSAGTYFWRLRYMSARSSNKWVFIGGAEILSEVGAGTATESTTSTSYVALSTAGPSITVPVAGDYIVTIAADHINTTNADPFMSYDIGGTGAVDADAAMSNWTNGGNGAAMYKQRKKSLTAVTLTAKYKTNDANTAAFRNRTMTLLPIAIGG